jgi:hypothetical protein
VHCAESAYPSSDIGSGCTNTENRFVILRVDDAQVRRVLSALEERTGRAPQAVGQRKRTR